MANRGALVHLALLQIMRDGLLRAPWHNPHPKGDVNGGGPAVSTLFDDFVSGD